MERYTFVVFKDRRGKYRFRILAGNGKILAKSTKGYSDKEEVLDVARSLNEKPIKDELFKDRAFENRWRLIDEDDTILCVASEGYKDMSYCSSMLNNIKSFVQDSDPLQVKCI